MQNYGAAARIQGKLENSRQLEFAAETAQIALATETVRG